MPCVGSVNQAWFCLSEVVLSSTKACEELQCCGWAVSCVSDQHPGCVPNQDVKEKGTLSLGSLFLNVFLDVLGCRMLSPPIRGRERWGCLVNLCCDAGAYTMADLTPQRPMFLSQGRVAEVMLRCSEMGICLFSLTAAHSGFCGNAH